MGACKIIGLFLIALVGLPAVAQNCSHPLDPAFYEAHHYQIRRIAMESPFDFFFLVRQRFDSIKHSLPIKEGADFSVSSYNEAFPIVDKAVKEDNAFGNEFPAKVVVVEGGLINCIETGNSLSVDVVYRVFSTDPIPAAQATPEQQSEIVKNPTTHIAASNLKPDFTVQPLFHFDASRRGFGGADASVSIPGGVITKIRVSGGGSSSSKAFQGDLEGVKNPSLTFLNHAEYHVAYKYDDSPASDLRLRTGGIQARLEGMSKPVEFAHMGLSVRYGTSLQQGNQQSNLPPNGAPGAIGNSPFGALKFYGGLTSTTRRSEFAVSYGLELAGEGLGSIDYKKHIGNLSYGIRFPGHSHHSWDFSGTFATGGIAGSAMIPINDRFFGGNSVSHFIEGDRWSISDGPVIRSIPTNRLTGEGFGGTSFFSTNLTLGKVIVAWPMIPEEVENAAGFGDAVTAAEASAQNWFADDYEASSPEFVRLLKNFPAQLQNDLDSAQTNFLKLEPTAVTSSALQNALQDAEREARLAQNLIRNVSLPGSRGPDNANKLRAWSLPQSRFVLLAKAIEKIEPLVSPAMAAQMEEVRHSITGHLKTLADSISAIHSGSVRRTAEARAAKDMMRPREVIDSLRFETNRLAFGIVGLFDAARVWPDPHGTRYAIGAGARLGIVNVNFTVGYAINPSPQNQLGQGRGALVLSLTYTNLFR